MSITSVKLLCGRSTLLRWIKIIRGLTVRYKVPVQGVGDLSALPQLPPDVAFSGLELLLDVGRACTRPEVSDDPERLFALFRYATKICADNENMRLSNVVYDMDTHKKKVLSDEFGCGFSFLISRHLLGTSVFLDTSTAIRRGWVQTESSRSKQPDYLSWRTNNGVPVVLEAKGTQSKGYGKKQIARGCDQVRAVVLPRVSHAIRIVVGVELQRLDQEHETTVLVGDPESADRYEYAFRGSLVEIIARCHYFRVAALIGDTQLLAHLGGHESEGEARLEEFEIGTRTYVGSALQFRHGDSSATFRIGIDQEVRGQLLASARYASLLERIQHADDSSVEHRLQNAVRRGDGTILSFQLEGPLSELEE